MLKHVQCGVLVTVTLSAKFKLCFRIRNPKSPPFRGDFVYLKNESITCPVLDATTNVFCKTFVSFKPVSESGLREHRLIPISANCKQYQALYLNVPI
jgi:hypothetical protein